ncbi:MAG: uroporphyrinogen decarboxylase [Firmicutes bacterium]|jgi:uroporphyrinogen decarboxylase|nr:uroporphyrinogen decarboxylase family protein [Bacillota bacterium]NLL87328.1 uroporphyrinogen decarboxylase [Bacillota bacterium]HKM17806.1 uroporphyrinogen decarboxylase family protein [Limnochordia bacterium]
MKPIERVTLTLQHKEADRVPVYPLMCGVARKLVGASYPRWSTDMDVCAEAYEKVTEEFDLDVICTLIDLSVEAADFGQSVIYPENEAAHPDFNRYMLKNTADINALQPIRFIDSIRMKGMVELCGRLMNSKGADVPVVAFVFGPLGVLSMMRGQADLFMDILDDPDAVKNGVAAVTETLLEYVDALAATGVPAIMLDTLYASQSIMSKSMWLEFEGPYVRRIAERIRKHGCQVMIHNCGNGIYFDAQIETMKPVAISFLHLPDDCQSPRELKEKYGSQVTLIGRIPPTWLLTCTQEELEEECRREIDDYKAGGGFILATGCEYPANLGLEHARTIVRMAKEYGKY